VWPNGVVWFEDYGLRFMNNQGDVGRVKGVPAWYGRLAYGPDSLYFIKKGVLMSIAAYDLTPRTETSLAAIAGLDHGQQVRGSILGLLGPDDPLLRITYRSDDGKVTRLHSIKRGPMPLPAEWTYVTSPVGRFLLALDNKHRTLAALRSADLRPLWTRRFYDGTRPITLDPPRFTPSGRKVVLQTGSDRHGVAITILDAATGRVDNRLRLPSFNVVFEDDSHFVYEAYDGPPNPHFDPRDTFPEVVELDWPNLLIRCSLRRECELAARVDPPEQALKTGTTFLFPRP